MFFFFSLYLITIMSYTSHPVITVAFCFRSPLSRRNLSHLLVLKFWQYSVVFWVRVFTSIYYNTAFCIILLIKIASSSYCNLVHVQLTHQFCSISFFSICSIGFLNFSIFCKPPSIATPFINSSYSKHTFHQPTVV